MTVSPDALVADLVLEQPGRAGVLERYGIDYCCGGRVPLRDACRERGLEPAELVAALAAAPAPAQGEVDPGSLDLDELAAHIVARHHAYLREELPPLRALVEKVARVHGDRHPELGELEAVFTGVHAELVEHLREEEEIVFPACVAADGSGRAVLAEAVERMESDHEAVGAGLARLRELTAGYEPPPDACTSYRVMLQRLEALELDVHQHVHKENNVLFPRALAAVDA